ncbi:MAG: imidazole glycerol phosphate synthase subunit HisF [Lachnospiraceae bacterium]|jgi:cyclase|nr:imidazole glycerol phosphate synthase subunit HisF [Lachnospiraceae bacterium]
MLKKRIIPCLDIKDGKVVKGVNFVNLIDVGDPVLVAKEYENQCADEVVFLDITASSDNRETIYDLVKRAAKELSIPLTIGGGIRTIEDFRKILNCGADKVSINTSAIKNPNLIKEAAEEFGSQCVVVAIDAKLIDGKYKVFVKGGREDTGIFLEDWVKQVSDLGAGEILLTSMDGDGTCKGYDIPMLNVVCDLVNIPVIASGGCGSIKDIINCFKETKSDAALVASLFHFGKATVSEVKEEMIKNNIPARIV